MCVCIKLHFRSAKAEGVPLQETCPFYADPNKQDAGPWTGCLTVKEIKCTLESNYTKGSLEMEVDVWIVFVLVNRWMTHEPGASVSAVIVFSWAYLGVFSFASLINIQDSGPVYSQAVLSWVSQHPHGRRGCYSISSRLTPYAPCLNVWCVCMCEASLCTHDTQLSVWAAWTAIFMNFPASPFIWAFVFTHSLHSPDTRLAPILPLHIQRLLVPPAPLITITTHFNHIQSASGLMWLTPAQSHSSQC